MTALQEIRHTPPSTDTYNARLLRKSLREIGYSMLPFASSLQSTMSLIEHYALAGGETPAVAIADHQTHGKGRENRSWYDKAGASILLTAFFRLNDQSAIAPFANLVALRACQTLRQITGSGEIKIKYPNDIVFRDKKLGGILVENVYDDNPHHRYVGTSTGIGINVHYEEMELAQPSFDYPGTALDVVTGTINSRQQIITQMLQAIRHLDVDAVIIRNGGESTETYYDRAWRACSALLDREVIIEHGDRIVREGRVVDTRIRWGIQLQSSEWINLFDTNTKVYTKEEYGTRPRG